MSTFPDHSPLAEPVDDAVIDQFTMSYMKGLARDRAHQLLLDAFIESGLTKTELAKRLGADKSRVSRILSYAGNITIDTIGEFLFAIDGSTPQIDRCWPLRDGATNQTHPIWFHDAMDVANIQSSTLRKSTPSASVSSSKPDFYQVHAVALKEDEHA